MATFGVLTGGGDCPGLNAVIRAVVRRGLADNHSFIGFHGGWRGLREDDCQPLDLANTAGLVTRGGTILGTSRTDPLASGAGGLDELRETIARRGIQAVVVTGGDGTLGAARDLCREGIPLVGIPKTIDNDVSGTDFSVGFQTAVQIATDAIDRLHTTAESHNRVMIVEVMGRHAGWIATAAGLASGADMILVPERPFAVDDVCEQLRARHRKSRNFSIVVVAEGARATDPDWQPLTESDQHLAGDSLAGATTSHPRSAATASGVGFKLCEQIEARTGFDTKVTVLGHVQRGGTPVAFDRILATRFGVAAAEAMLSGRYGCMTALRDERIVEVDLAEALAQPKALDPTLYETAAVFFG
ncbi:6-phosphofructokinase [Conexibacter sp. S30A1]|uniref:6-phosphofructokinase n=1 Tax=Conexibacter sp. S30A1 TaxID=2937800 RepID=UPI00200D120D|nr:ATP-dependent 6-phosphofructokinase [Conexibacter sp. S30A1]